MLHLLVFVALPASPWNDQIRVDLAEEVFSTGQPAVEVLKGRVITRLLLILLWPCHADILGQELNKHLQI